ncbi:MAG: 3-oxo-tetronate kinase [bacterium]
MLIGAVADDVTGATDLCLMLSRSGLHTVQVMGVPDPARPLPDADAVVVALKSRTIPADQAVQMSLAAARALLAGGSHQLLFKYCSTFDSTDLGNIGPVTAALMDLTGAISTIACPAFPANGRTVYQGHLFVGTKLLSDSPMKDHPLTPMRDADLVAVLSRQTAVPVGLIAHATVAQGAAAIRAAMTTGIHIIDTLDDADLMTIGKACADLPLVTGGSGIALGLAANFARTLQPAALRMPHGRSVILAGSCSQATRGQIEAAKAAGHPALSLDLAALTQGRQSAEDLARWATQQTGLPPVIYSSVPPEDLARIQAEFGRDAAGALVEDTLGQVARLLQLSGFTRFIIAGGETSGAVVQALGVTTLEIGPEIAPGVPWTHSINGPDLAFTLKSGNFGGPDFFTKALSDLAELTR